MEYQKLFDHMAGEHNLILLESEMQDIIHICQEMPNLKEANKYE